MEEIQKFYKLEPREITPPPPADDDNEKLTIEETLQCRDAEKGAKYDDCTFEVGDFQDKFSNYLPPVDSNIGGYYGWVQDDPLSASEDHGHEIVKKDKAVTLFFLDSNTPCHHPPIRCVMWGDVGTGVWVMNEEDLVNLNFDRHGFSMDCC